MSDVSGLRRADLLRDMVVFVEVGRCGSFTGAAKALGIPASTVARRIAALEAELGLLLVRRSTRDQALTPEGLRCFERCGGAVDDALAATAEVHARARGASGRIRLALPAEAVGAMAPIVASFLRENERIEIAVEAHDGRHRVGQDFDLVIRLGLPDDGALVARQVGAIGLRLFASLDHPAAMGAVASRTDLLRQDLLIAEGCAGALDRLPAGGSPSAPSRSRPAWRSAARASPCCRPASPPPSCARRRSGPCSMAGRRCRCPSSS